MASHGSEHHDPPTSTTGGGGSEARLPAHVYRRRRLVALAVIALLLLLLVVGVVRGVRAVTGSGGQDTAQDAAAQRPAATAQATADPEQKFADFTPRPDPSGSASSSAPGTPSPSSTAVPACGADLSVTASTDKETYAAKEQPVLTMTLQNTGNHPCTVDAGTSKMVFTVVSGSDTVFDSRHCAAGGDDRKLTLDAGAKETARLSWNRTRTAQGCPAGQAEAAAGYYKLTATLGDTTSAPAAFVLQ
ncbi:hypothetical protein [Kocuria sp.]|uniref:hypothetical protein n=1 Tax=Kocuria sp. TaxID=1871328 RepID=UPI0026DD7F5C|nr:hypothetical protein [Kocuria sp.]MDO4919219.1 hypothetical protein [Kocuria sp.]